MSRWFLRVFSEEVSYVEADFPANKLTYYEWNGSKPRKVSGVLGGSGLMGEVVEIQVQEGSLVELSREPDTSAWEGL